MRDRRLYSMSVQIAFVTIGLLMLTAFCSGQEAECPYDRGHPTIENASSLSQAGSFRCARLELLDLLAIDSISDRERADAHIWLGIVYYRSLRVEVERIDSALTQFVTAVRQYPEYRGPLAEDTTTDLGRLFTRAERRVADSIADETIRAIRVRDSICGQYQCAKKSNTLRKVVTGAVLAGATLGTVILNGKANDSYDVYREAISPGDIESAWDNYESNKKTRNIMIGVASVAAVAEIYWFIKGPKKPDVDCSQPMNRSEKPQLGLQFDGHGVQLTLGIQGL